MPYSDVGLRVVKEIYGNHLGVLGVPKRDYLNTPERMLSLVV